MVIRFRIQSFIQIGWEMRRSLAFKERLTLGHGFIYYYYYYLFIIIIIIILLFLKSSPGEPGTTERNEQDPKHWSQVRSSQI